MDVIVATVGVVVVLVLLLFKLTLRLAAPPASPLTAACLDELSLDPANLVRLLDEALPGSDTHLMQKHCQDLEADFKRVCLAIKLILVNSDRDRPDLASALLRKQATFAFGMLSLRFRLACHRHLT